MHPFVPLKYVRMKGLFFLSALSAASFAFAQSKQDSVREIDEVRVIKRLPVTKEVVNVEKDLSRKNLGQDLPYLLKNQISVETTSDAGNGVGYTGLRIRGVDATRINVMLNGVPYNDSESQGTFFVNMPDVTSSASNIIIQRGVGTSSNGVAAFGASVNIISRDPDEQPYFSTQNSVGSFNTHKHSFEAGTGSLLNGKLSFMGRYSIIKSDGYIDRAFSDLNSYNFVGVYKDGNTKIRFQTFGGKEKTYQAWNGISKEQYELNPRYNPSGEIYDKEGKVVGFYGNETDNYKQRHYHLLWEQRFNDDWKLNTTLHYTRGLGYYENYNSNQEFSDYGIPPSTIGNEKVTTGDLVSRKWLDNDFYGFVSELNGKVNQWDLNFGLVANQYYGRHYGQIISGSNLQQLSLPVEYYRNNATKSEISGYAKALYRFGDFEVFGDIQLRNIIYKSNVVLANPEEAPVFDKKYTFFNPKAGINYHLDGGVLYFSYANAHREPVRNDIVANPDIKPEKLHDFELGYNKTFGNLSLTANAYYMLYKDQLVLSGAINNVGAPLRQNVGKSYRAGIEVGAGYSFTEKFNVLMNATFSQNKNKDYIIQLSKTEIQHLGTTNTSFAPNFIGNITLNYLPVKDLQFSWVNKLVGSQHLDNTDAPENKINSYYLSDIIASYNVRWGKTDIGFNLLVNNLFNQKYINNGYAGPFYYAQAGTNFLAGISLKFN